MTLVIVLVSENNLDKLFLFKGYILRVSNYVVCVRYLTCTVILKTFFTDVILYISIQN